MVLFVAWLSGCGGDIDHRPPLVPAGGELLFDGQPLAGAQVVFVPPTNDRPAAFATTDEQGRFSLTTFVLHDGAVPGDYIVTITKQQAAQTMTTDEASAYFARTGNPPPRTKFVDLIPANYGSRTASGLSASVATDGENRFSFHLSQSGR